MKIQMSKFKYQINDKCQNAKVFFEFDIGVLKFELCLNFEL
jgi:hypothetical protein